MLSRVWDNRIVAVQMRLLLQEDELFGMLGKEHTALDIDPRGGTAAIVFRQLAAHSRSGLCIPDLAAVQEVLSEYQHAHEATGIVPAGY